MGWSPEDHASIMAVLRERSGSLAPTEPPATTTLIWISNACYR